MADALRDLILRRRSVRRFKKDRIEAKVTERLVEALRWAPSAGNMQPWRFFFITHAGLRKALARAAWEQSFIAEAPLVVAVCACPGESAARYGARGSDFFCLMDCAAAIQNLLLTCTALGLGSCWVSAFDDPAVAEALGVPADERPVAIIPIGYPDQQPKAPPRRKPETIVRFIE
jgi:nitroreductase